MKNEEVVHLRVNQKTKKFVEKKAKDFGSMKRYHMYLYEKDGLKITAKDL